MKRPLSIIRKIGAKNGLYLGLALIFLYLTLYYISLDLFLEWWITFIKLFLIIGFCLLAIFNSKKIITGSFSFRDAFAAFFVCILVGTLMFTVFNFLLFHEIDPAAGKYIGQESINQLEAQTSGGTKVPEEFQKQLTQMRAEDQYGFFYQMKGFIFNLAGYSIIGIFLALIFRSKTIKKA